MSLRVFIVALGLVACAHTEPATIPVTAPATVPEPVPEAATATEPPQHLTAAIAGTPSPTGAARASATIRIVLRRVAGSVGACAASIGPLPSPLPVTEFTIGPDGHVIATRLTGWPAAVAACVDKALRAVIFPAPADGSTIVVRFPWNELTNDH